MQPECDQSIRLFRKVHSIAGRTTTLALVILTWVCATGCEQKVSTIDPPREQPFKNQSLEVVCSNSVEPLELVKQYTREWEMRQSVNARVRTSDLEPFSGDIAIVTAGQLPLLAATGQFLPVPDSITRNNENPFHWFGMIPSFAGPIVSWGGVEYALPLMGEGHVLVYRKDRFEEARLSVPLSWEDYVTAAKALAQPDRPSLPPLPKRTVDLEVEFYLIAASYDRQGLNQADLVRALKDLDAADQLLSFHYRLKTGATRINAPAFVEALKLLRELQPFRTAGEYDDPATFFANGSASLAIVSLRDVYRCQEQPSVVRGKFGIAPVPGSRYSLVLDADGRTQRVPTPGNAVNRIPFLGSRTLVGLVSSKCANPELAWQFLAGFAIPDKMGAEAIIAGKWGAGPFRYLHIEERGRFLWYGYDLPREDTERLIVALKEQLQPSIVNPCYCLRLPDGKAHTRAFDAVIRPALTGKQDDPQRALDDLSARWKALSKDVSERQRRDWVQMCYGLPAE
jgi:multiple sugar transport system substrate-binding protein